MPTRIGLVWQAGALPIVATGVKPHLQTSGTQLNSSLEIAEKDFVATLAGMQICVTLVLHSWCHIGNICD